MSSQLEEAQQLIRHMEEDIERLNAELAGARRGMVYLADCHAATAEHDGRLKSTSQYRRKRLQEIAFRASTLIKAGGLFGSLSECRDPADVLKRCVRASRDEEGN